MFIRKMARAEAYLSLASSVSLPPWAACSRFRNPALNDDWRLSRFLWLEPLGKLDVDVLPIWE